MKIVVVGLGGVGGIVGGRLANGLSDSPEHDVVFWCRGQTLDAIDKEGLHILNGNERLTVRPSLATCRHQDVGSADLFILATKGYHLGDAARDIASMAAPGASVIPLLNGLNAASVLERELPECDILEGCIYVSAHVDNPGTVQQVGSVQRVIFGKKGISEAENRIRYGQIEQVLKKSGIGITLTERIDVELWSKFIFLSPFAGVTTLHGLSIGEVLNDEACFEKVSGMIGEVEALAQAKGVKLPEKIADLTVEKARAFPSPTKTSMQMDHEKGRKTEIESLIGYVCEEGKALGVPTPLYDEVYDFLRTICKS